MHNTPKRYARFAPHNIAQFPLVQQEFPLDIWRCVEPKLCSEWGVRLHVNMSRVRLLYRCAADFPANTDINQSPGFNQWSELAYQRPGVHPGYGSVRMIYTFVSGSIEFTHAQVALGWIPSMWAVCKRSWITYLHTYLTYLLTHLLT